MKGQGRDCPTQRWRTAHHLAVERVRTAAHTRMRAIHIRGERRGRRVDAPKGFAVSDDVSMGTSLALNLELTWYNDPAPQSADGSGKWKRLDASGSAQESRLRA